MNEHTSHFLLPTDLTVNMEDLLHQVLMLKPPPGSRLTLLHVREAPGMRDERLHLNAFRHLPSVLYLPQRPETDARGGVAADVPPTLQAVSDGMRRRGETAQKGDAHRSPHSSGNGSPRPGQQDPTPHLFVQAVCRYGDITQEILTYAQEADVETILMHVKPRTGWRKWKRSISKAVMQQAPCRIVLIRSLGREQSDPEAKVWNRLTRLFHRPQHHLT